MSSKWRIHELSEQVARALAIAEYEGQDSARVREVPDVRTIRYYTTVGLLDRPLEMQGRTAFYGRRHLWQLVAVKKLQAQGLSLVEVQASLAGASDKRLAQIADLPADFFITTDDKQAVQAQAPLATRRSFWADAPEWRPPTRAAEPSLSPAVVLRIDSHAALLIEGVPPEKLTGEALALLEPALARVREALCHIDSLNSREPEPTAGKDQENET